MARRKIFDLSAVFLFKAVHPGEVKPATKRVDGMM
jgi:hypothetical protein